jgi:hypothetical protein
MIWRTWLVKKVGEEYCLGEWEYIFCVNMNIQRYGKWGQVRGEEELCYQFKEKNQLKTCLLVFPWFLPDVLTGWPILPKSSLINQ